MIALWLWLWLPSSCCSCQCRRGKIHALGGVSVPAKTSAKTFWRISRQNKTGVSRQKFRRIHVATVADKPVDQDHGGRFHRPDERWEPWRYSSQSENIHLQIMGSHWLTLHSLILCTALRRLIHLRLHHVAGSRVLQHKFRRFGLPLY